MPCPIVEALAVSHESQHHSGHQGVLAKLRAHEVTKPPSQRWLASFTCHIPVGKLTLPHERNDKDSRHTHCTIDNPDRRARARGQIGRASCREREQSSAEEERTHQQLKHTRTKAKWN